MNTPIYLYCLAHNIYGDTDNPLVLKEKYKKLGGNYKYKKPKAQSDILAIWDDTMTMVKMMREKNFQ